MSYPGIPAVTSDQHLAATVRALVEVVEILTGDRGNGTLKAVTKTDLQAMGVATASSNTSLHTELTMRVSSLESRLSALENRYNAVFGPD